MLIYRPTVELQWHIRLHCRSMHQTLQIMQSVTNVFLKLTSITIVLNNTGSYKVLDCHLLSNFHLQAFGYKEKEEEELKKKEEENAT